MKKAVEVKLNVGASRNYYTLSGKPWTEAKNFSLQSITAKTCIEIFDQIKKSEELQFKNGYYVLPIYSIPTAGARLERYVVQFKFEYEGKKKEALVLIGISGKTFKVSNEEDDAILDILHIIPPVVLLNALKSFKNNGKIRVDLVNWLICAEQIISMSPESVNFKIKIVENNNNLIFTVAFNNGESYKLSFYGREKRDIINCLYHDSRNQKKSKYQNDSVSYADFLAATDMKNLSSAEALAELMDRMIVDSDSQIKEYLDYLAPTATKHCLEGK